jgi:hypothetical protein
MSYCTIRVYSGLGAGEVPPVMDMVKSDLVPIIAKTKGLQRYTGVHTSDGRIASVSFFDDKQGADQAAAAVRAFLPTRPELGKLHLAMAMEGEVGLAIAGPSSMGPGMHAGGTAHGAIRISKMVAPFAEVNAAIEAEGLAVLRAIPGLMRYTTVNAGDGRLVTLSAFTSEQAARDSTAKAKELIAKPGSKLAKVFGGSMEAIEVSIVFVHVA